MHFGPDSEVYVKPLQTGLEHVPFRSGPILAPIIGVLYGIFVEWDDGGGKKDAAREEGRRSDAPPAPPRRRKP